MTKVYSINIENFDSNSEFICFNNLLSQGISLFTGTEMYYVEINLEYLKRLGDKIINGSELGINCFIFISNNEILNNIYNNNYMNDFKKEIEQLSKELKESLYYNKKQLIKANANCKCIKSFPK